MKGLKWYLWIIGVCIIGIVVGIVTLWIMTYHRFGVSESIDSGLISGIGSLLGGLLGAFVAFGVARTQFLQEQLKSKEQRISGYRNIIRALLTELEHNKEIIDILQKNSKSNTHDQYANLLETEVWNHVRFDVNNLTSFSTYKLLDEIYRDLKDIRSKSIGYTSKSTDYSTRSELIDKVCRELYSSLDKLPSI